ncbi:MAG: helix-turn-helix domain-containing protein [Solirubrobacterales bacterium]
MGQIGETLRERRMAMKVDVHEVEEKTKIRAKYLRALENEEYDLLPGSAYVKSFLRSYADYLGVESRPLIDQYKAEVERNEDEQPIFGTRLDPVKDRSLARRRRILAIVVAIIVVLAVLLVIGYVGGGSGSGA